MDTSRSSLRFCLLALLLAGCCIILPAFAADGRITISYRGSGGGYVGETIIFDGINTVGTMTAIKISGPGLAADGVPLYSLDGEPGTGNQAEVKEGKWTFPWDTSRIDQTRLQTARYTFTAWDRDNPDATSTTSLILKQPEFYLKAKPAEATVGDYVELIGMAEKGVSYIKLDVTDASGTSLRTFMAPISATGSFGYSFRADMPPGQYTITGTNPSMARTLRLAFPVTAAAATTTAPSGDSDGSPLAGTTTAPVTGETQPGSPTASQAPSPSPTTFARAGIHTETVLLAISLFGAIAVVVPRLKER